MIDVDSAGLQQFINSYMVYDVNEEFNRNNVKNFDASNLPTCKKEDTKNADEDIKYHHWIGKNELLNFNDDDNED
ncbi:uncharacterized protein TNCV_1725671 [Trichonephila clavipes]|nr:uncharacterized protein TNCV_1725671 [Trichonephila clavipes]